MEKGKATKKEKKQVSPRVGVLTGFTGVVGRLILKRLLAYNVLVILPMRNVTKARTCIKELANELGENIDHKVELVADVHFDSISSTLIFLDRLRRRREKLDFLINCVTAQLFEKHLSEDGIETTFHVNVLSHWLLMNELAPFLARGKGRIVNVSSCYTGELDIDDLFFEKRRYVYEHAFQQSKACNRLLSAAAARRWPELTINSCHRGLINEGPTKKLHNMTDEEWDKTHDSARTPVWLALDPRVKVTGKYFEKKEIKKCKYADMIRKQKRLWEIVHDLVIKSI